MKRLTGILLLFLLVFSTSCDTESPEKAKAYYKSIIDKINILTKDYEGELIKSFNEFVPSEMNQKLNALEGYVMQLDKDLGNMDDFYGDASLLDGGKEVVNAYKEALPIYKEIVKNESVPQDEYTEENSNIYKDLIKQINDKLNTVMDKNKETSKKFGRDHHVIIAESSLLDSI